LKLLAGPAVRDVISLKSAATQTEQHPSFELRPDGVRIDIFLLVFFVSVRIERAHNARTANGRGPARPIQRLRLVTDVEAPEVETYLNCQPRRVRAESARQERRLRSAAASMQRYLRPLRASAVRTSPVSRGPEHLTPGCRRADTHMRDASEPAWPYSISARWGDIDYRERGRSWRAWHNIQSMFERKVTPLSPGGSLAVLGLRALRSLGPQGAGHPRNQLAALQEVVVTARAARRAQQGSRSA